MPTLLTIDDDPLILQSYRFLFAELDATLVTAATAAEGIAQFQRTSPDAVLLDVRLPDRSGFEVFEKIHATDARIPVVLVTGYGTSATAIEAMRLGAFDYVVKPFDPDHLAQVMSLALETSRRMRVPAILPSADDATPEDGDLLLGRCPAMQEVYKAIGRVAAQDVTVLILGESGTGKELVARAIYQHSRRGSKPFLAVNCAAIPESLLESELFGYEKGAFTGADRRRIGKFEQCNGGTLFLDEIGDMTPLTQTKILRVLQQQPFERVGGSETINSDVRILAATNRDLAERMNEGLFRSDLFYRLNVFTIHLPPLRERPEDIPVLAEHFVRRYGQELQRDVRSIDPETLALLMAYPWPGNVREFQSVIKQTLLQSTGPVLLPHFLPAQLIGEHQPKTQAPAHSDQFPDLTGYLKARLSAGTTNLHAEVITETEKQLFRMVLDHARGNLSQAARILGITRPTLRARLSSLGLAATDES